MDNDQDDLFGGDAKAAKQAAINRIIERIGTWLERAIGALVLVNGFVGTTEAIRLRLVGMGLEPPPDPNHDWGAWTTAAIKREKLIPTGRYGHTTTERSHNRKVPVYRVRA